MNYTQFGLLSIELYIPKLYIDQDEFEKQKGISSGKITKGIGQLEMSYTSELEDVNSMALTVLKNLMTRNNIKSTDIGKLEFATETFHDKSKSSKTILMNLLSGNKNIEGVTNFNACYGGTAAIFNCLNWLKVESAGKLAIVVMSDVAVYNTIQAKPTGGSGAVAILLGPNPMIVLDPIRMSYFDDEYDFYKPFLHQEYPVVNGQFSTKLYTSVLLETYESLKVKYAEEEKRKLLLHEFDYFCFHCPFTKQVEKGFFNLFYKEILAGCYTPSNTAEFNNFIQEKPKFEEPLTQRYLREMLKTEYQTKLSPGFELNKKVGNIYTGSLYLSLISLVMGKEDSDLRKKKILMYSYGAGVSATIFSFTFTERFQKQAFVGLETVNRLFIERVKSTIDQFDDHNIRREHAYNATFLHNKPDAISLRFDTYYLEAVDQKGKRKYRLFTEMNSRVESIVNNFKNGKPKKFREMSLEEKTSYLNQETDSFIRNEYQHGGLDFQIADLMIENCIGTLKLPIGVALGFVINNKKRIIPMVTEEPSVIAAASNIASLISANSYGFKSISSKNIIRGNIFIEKVQFPENLPNILEQNKADLISFANTELCKRIVEKGGGVLDIQISKMPNNVFSIDFFVDVQNAMGANTVNTILEGIRPKIQNIINCNVVMAIISNLSPERIIKAFFEIPVKALAEEGFEGSEIARKIVLANDIASHNIFRATTHNKGIMNGIDAVALAVGQDFRAIEASCHAYSIYKHGKYGPLTRYWISDDGNLLKGEIEIPFLVGTVGGVTKSNKLYQLNLKLLGNPDARELGNILACVGLAQNLAALKKLVSEGLQKGHMKLHANNIAVGLGVDPDLITEVVEYMIRVKQISTDSAKDFLTKKGINGHSKIN